MQSTLRNESAGDSHSIGHLNIEIKCAATSYNDAVHVLTGATSASNNEARQLLLRERYGYGILFHNFAGRLYTAEEINADIKGRFENGTVSFMRWTISADTCSRIAQYFTEYVARGYEKSYGLPNQPRLGEGAGCSAFGMSFLEVAGLMDDAYKNSWQRFLRIPERYVGGPLTGRRVRLLPLLLPLRRTSWAEPDEAHFPILFWDPEAMHYWVKNVWNQNNVALPEMPFSRAQIGNALGLIFDATSVPTPIEPIWKL